MEDNKAKITDTDVSVTTNYGDVITLKTFREEFEWLRSDFWNLTTRIDTLEEENRKLKEKVNDYEYHMTSNINRMNEFENMFDHCLGKLNKVSEYVGEMSKDYIHDYVYVNTE